MRSVRLAAPIASAALAALVASCGGGGDSTSPTPQPATVTISLSSTDTMHAIGDTRALTAVVKDSTGATMSGQTVTWLSRGAGVASVSPATGLASTATATGNGTAFIVASTANGKQDSVAVSVRQAYADLGLSLSAPTIQVAGTSTATATARDSRGNAIAGLSGATFSSANEAVATINATTGAITGVSNGTSVISAVLGDAEHTDTATATLTVSTVVVAFNDTISTVGFSFTPDSVDVPAGTTIVFMLNGAVAHTVTFDSNPPPEGDVPLTAGGAGGAFFPRSFNTPGRVAYHCAVHGSPGAGMHGVIIVH